MFWFSVICAVTGLFMVAGGPGGPGGAVCNYPEEQEIKPVKRRGGKAFCLLCV